MNTIHRFSIGIAVALTLAIDVTPAAAIDVDENSVVWGFDGQVIPNQLTPVTFDVFNASADPFDGTISLARTMGISRMDAPYLQPLFLSPGTARRVTFTPYITDTNSEWRVSWGRRPDESIKLPEPKVGTPAIVVFSSDDFISSSAGGVRYFNESALPTSAAAMQGLEAVLLDHVPTWDAPRRQAFLDWLRSGGELHLFAEAGGAPPAFTAQLALLNRPEPSFHVGAGTVRRHEASLSTVNRQWVKDHVATATRVRRATEPDDPDEATDQAMVNYNMADQFVQMIRSDLDPLRSIFPKLKQMTQPDHNWVVIAIIGLGYLLVLFPGAWRLAKRHVDYRLVYGVLIGAALLFSLAFRWIGARGYGESTVVHSFAIARPLTDEQCLVECWSDLFVVGGDTYQCRPPGRDIVMSAPTFVEQVKGGVTSGPDATLTVDVPPFSSRPFLSASVVDVAPPQVNVTKLLMREDVADVEQISENPELNVLTFEVDESSSGTIHEAYAFYNRSAYRVGRSGTSFTTQSRVMETSELLQPVEPYQPPFQWNEWDAEVDVAQQFQQMQSTMLRRAIMSALPALPDQISSKTPLLSPRDRVRLALIADLPPAMQANIGTGTRQEGRVIYLIDLFLPDPEK